MSATQEIEPKRKPKFENNRWYKVIALIAFFGLIVLTLLEPEKTQSDYVLLFTFTATAILVLIPMRFPKPESDRASPPLSDRCQEAARDPARKIEAIRIYREETGLGLREAKIAVEAFITQAADNSPANVS